MTSVDHTKGLLHEGKYGVVHDSNGDMLRVNGLALSGSYISEANSKRIISCWNACEGIDQETLDGGWTAKGMSDYAKQLEAQRDELLSVLREVVLLDGVKINAVMDDSSAGFVIDRAKEVTDKVTNKASSLASTYKGQESNAGSLSVQAGG
jgi:hypothetical protein